MNDPTETPESLPLNNILRNNRGVIIEGIAQSDFSYEGLRIIRGTRITFYECGLPLYVDLKENLLVNGITYKAGTRLDFFDSPHIPSRGILAVEARWTQMGVGLLFQAGSEISFHRTGNVEQGTNISNIALSRPYHLFKLGSGNITFYESGYIATAINQLETQIVTPHPCRIATGYMRLHEVGAGNFASIKIAQFAENTMWSGIPVTAARSAEFFKASEYMQLGRLRSATLSEDWTIEADASPTHAVFPQTKGSYIELYENGTPRQVSLHLDQTIMGISFKAGTGYVKLYRNGLIDEFVSEHPVFVQGVNIPKNTRACFDENGTLIKPQDFYM